MVDDQNLEEIANSGTQELDILSVEEFVERFTDMYESSLDFRNDVMDFAKLSKFENVLYVFGQHMPGFKFMYRKQRDKMLTKWAVKARQEFIDNKDMLEEARAQAADVNASIEAERELNEYKRALGQHETSLISIGEDGRELVEGAESKKLLEIRKLEEQAASERQRIIDEKNVKNIVEGKLKSIFNRSGIAETDEYGRVRWSTSIEKAVEDALLDGILINQMGENPGSFMATMSNYFEESDDGELIFRQARDPDEWERMDFEKSIEMSAEHGYPVPTFPYLVVSEFKPISLYKVGVDSATTIDISGSMRGQKYRVAKEVCGAVNSMMRRMNEKNNSYLGVFSGRAHDTTLHDLYHTIRPGGGTNLADALNWGLEKFEGRDGPCIVNVATDGAPNSVNDSIEAAAKYRDRPNVSLILYLINPLPETKDILRLIGKAAGDNSRFIPIGIDKLGNNFVQGIADEIKKAYTLQQFEQVA